MSAETAALEAVMDGREQDALEILEDFFPSELDEIKGHAERLADLADTVLREKSAR